MKPVAIGVRMHSGWGALVVVSTDAGAPLIVARHKIVVTDGTISGAIQPYHFAERLGLPAGEKHIANCAAISQRLALAALQAILRELHANGYRVAGAAMLLASGRPLPPLPKILSAHPLIHTAEGEFFREAVRKACERLEIQVTGIRERELDDRAESAFGNAATRVQRKIAIMGRSLGPPWTTDHKTAALAALIVLAG